MVIYRQSYFPAGVLHAGTALHGKGVSERKPDRRPINVQGDLDSSYIWHDLSQCMEYVQYTILGNRYV
jgi:hypothetical protein